MFKAFLITWGKVIVAYPALVAAMYGLMEGAKANGFEKAEPQKYADFSGFVNWTLGRLVEHWLGWLLLSALISMLWTYMADEPRSVSKAAFDQRRREAQDARKGRD